MAFLKRSLSSKLVLLLGIVVSALYWIVEAAADTLVDNEVFTERLWPNDPKELWLRSTVVAIIVASSAYAQFLVNRKKRTERTLRENERCFRQLFNQSADALLVHDARGRIVDCNEEASRSLGYTREECLSLSVRDIATNLLSDEEKRTRDGGSLWERVLTGEPGEIVGVHLGEHRRKDGTTFPVEVRVSSVDYGGERMILASARDITERNRREQQIRESVERYWLVVQATHEVIWDNDFKSGTQHLDGALEAILGYSASKVSADRGWWKERLHPDDRERVLSSLQEALESYGEAWSSEYRFRRTDGTYSTIFDRGYVVRGEDGEPVRMVGSMMDTTELKRAEEEIRHLNETLEQRVEERTAQLAAALDDLRSSDERYRLLFDAASDGIWDWDILTGEIYWNDRFFEMLGLARSEVDPSFDHLVELLHPEDKQRSLDAVTAHLERGVPYDEELRIWRSDGEYLTVIGRGQAMRDQSGAPVRMMGILLDITERKRAEETQRFLTEAGEVLSSSLDYRKTLADVAHLAVPALSDWCAVDVLEEDGSSVNVAVAHKDPEKVAWVRELRQRYASDPEAPRGVSNVLRTGTSEFYPEISDEMLKEAARNEEHLKLIHELGFVSVIIVPMVARRKTLGAITLVTAESKRRFEENDLKLAEEMARKAALAVDNSRLYEAAQEELIQRRRTEEEIRELNETLEKRIEERTAELVDARDAAESAAHAKSEFLASMSHEIRTPMNGVIGMTGLLQDTDLSPEQRDYVETIRRSGENLLTIINDILDFSKIEAGRLDIETIDFDLRHTVEETVSLFAERTHEKGLELAHLVNYDVPEALRGDPGRLTQILTNLIGNAIKFTEEGEVVLRVELAPAAEETDESATIRFSVTDTGIGMLEEQQSRLFQSFTQADASTTRRYGGTGLGLAISKQLVELMGGEIGVESEQGVGSTFWFTIPFEKQPEEEADPKPRTDLQGLRVLVVDDNAANREITHQLVLSWGMMNGTAEDAQSALRVLRLAAEGGESYDIAILDMHMPEVNGIELARKIKAESEISQVRLVLLTSLGQRGEAREAKEAGISAYLTKPVRSSQLYDTLATVMGSSEEAEEEEMPIVTRHTILEERARSRARLLIAEDNAVNQKVAVKMLESLGYRVDVAANGLEALQALSRVSYAAILMDCHMPEMDGYEATGEIRRREQGTSRHIPIIALTASALKSDQETALGAGMDDYITKPVKREVLQEALERWVSHDEEASPEEVRAQAGGTAPTDVQEETEEPLDGEVIENLRELGGSDSGLREA